MSAPGGRRSIPHMPHMRLAIVVLAAAVLALAPASSEAQDPTSALSVAPPYAAIPVGARVRVARAGDEPRLVGRVSHVDGERLVVVTARRDTLVLAPAAVGEVEVSRGRARRAGAAVGAGVALVGCVALATGRRSPGATVLDFFALYGLVCGPAGAWVGGWLAPERWRRVAWP